MTFAVVAPRDIYPALAGSEVAVFGWDLDDPPLGVDGSVLSPDELERARRLRPGADRRRYQRGRATLRHVLASYVGVPPASLRFSYNAYGKPSVPGAPEFNLAHCGDKAVLALQGAGRVGIDIERVQPGGADPAVAGQFFAPGEVEELRRLAPEEAEAAFFRCWSRKEAFVKALGGGLSIELARFRVSLGATARSGLLACSLPAVEARSWVLFDLSRYWPGYAVAVASEMGASRSPSRQQPTPEPHVVFLDGPARGLANRQVSW